MKELHKPGQAGGPAQAGGIGGPGTSSRSRGPMGGPMRGPGGHMSMTAEKPKNFKSTLKRLVKYLEPRKIALMAVLLTAIISTLFSIVSPKILGRATTELFRGLMARTMGMPGAAIDFEYILRIVVILAGLYIISAVFLYIQQFLMAGVAQRTVYDLREAVSPKLTRLLEDEYPGSVHVRDAALKGAAGRVIWEHARENGFVIVSKDGTGTWSSLISSGSSVQPRIIPSAPSATSLPDISRQASLDSSRNFSTTSSSMIIECILSTSSAPGMTTSMP